MAIQSLIQSYRQMRTKPMWTLLASDNACETLSHLQILLFDKDRSLPASVFLARLQEQLDSLTSETVNRGQTQAKVNQWTKAGFLRLSYIQGQEEPCYELTSEAHEAIRFISAQRDNRISPTESRLELVIHAIRKLAQDTDSDAQTRIARLKEDQARLQLQIEALEAGVVPEIRDEEVRAQFYDILEMIENLNGDFYRVRDRFQMLSQSFHEAIMENEGTAGSILDKFFVGYDGIAESDEGKTFRGFYALINNAQAMAQVEEAVSALQDRPSWQTLLNNKERQTILYMRRNLNLRARETQQIMKLLASSLKHVVQSHDYQRNRRMLDLIGEARHEALALREKVTSNRALLTLPQSTASISSLSNMSLFDPQTEATIVEMITAAPEMVDLEALATRVQAAEINYSWLKRCVQSTLETTQNASVGDVLERFPASQGLASVVGLMSLAVRYGGVHISDKTEAVSWEDRFGQTVDAHIPLLIFNQETVENWHHLNLQRRG